jgi:uncharacterized repeat protein (TIGR03803 family)
VGICVKFFVSRATVNTTSLSSPQEENQMRKATSFLITLLAFLAFPSLPAQAQTFTTLHAFTGGTDGGNPFAGLVIDKEGNLYGTTFQGGDLACSSGYGCGTVFKLDTTGGETVLYSFTNVPDGAFPFAGLIRDKGNLYGTTAYGGSGNCYSYIGTLVGCGTVFKLDTTGKETVLHSFTDTPDGAQPEAGLVRDKEGNLYGTTVVGGTGGTVFKVDTNGTEIILNSFAGGGAVDGGGPEAGLVIDKEGDLYGTTTGGGPFGYGTVFKLDTTGKETVLHYFTNTPDGAYPDAGLIMDKEGHLYGTASEGGSSGYGTVFKVDSSGKETVLHSFSGLDGAYPFAGLVMDREGNLYGTTAYGGASFIGPPDSIGAGTVFKVDRSGKESVLHSFSGLDGNYPSADLVMDKKGNLYGTTTFGGAYDYGTVFKLILNCDRNVEMHHCEGHSGQ